MKLLPFHTDVYLTCDILYGGKKVPVNVNELSCYAVAYNSMNKGEIRRAEIKLYQSGESQVKGVFYGKEQYHLGPYNIVLIKNEAIEGMAEFVSLDEFMFAINSDKACPCSLQISADFQLVNGASAYDIAVAHGFEGTEEEWLKSLQGKSLYQLMVDAGKFSGTEEEFLDEYLAIFNNLNTEISERKEADALLQSQIDKINLYSHNKVLPVSTNLDELFIGDDLEGSGSYYHNAGDSIYGILPNIVDSSTPFRLILQPMGFVDGQLVQLQKILVPSQTYLDTVEVFTRFYVNSTWTIWTPRSFNEDFNRDFS